MRITRTITAAVLAAAALAGPAAAAGQQGADESAKANVYVPPAAAFSAPADDPVTANVYVPPNPQPIAEHVPAASASSSDFDWGSAGIGGAAAIGTSVIALGGAVALRRRRQIQPAI
jgi:hypothetical protein